MSQHDIIEQHLADYMQGGENGVFWPVDVNGDTSHGWVERVDDPHQWTEDHGSAVPSKLYASDDQAATDFLRNLVEWLGKSYYDGLRLGWAIPEGLELPHPYIDFDDSVVPEKAPEPVPHLYRVDIVERHTRSIEVEAPDPESAKAKAVEEAQKGNEGELQFHSDTDSDNWTVFNMETQQYES